MLMYFTMLYGCLLQAIQSALLSRVTDEEKEDKVMYVLGVCSRLYSVFLVMIMHTSTLCEASFALLLLYMAEVEIACGHLSFSVHLTRKTDH